MKRAAAAAIAVMATCALATAGFAADISSSTWSEHAPSNSGTPPNGFPENMQPSLLNNAAREMMAATKRWYNRANATLTSGGAANAQTLSYAVPPEAYRAGDGYSFIAGYTNTGSTTLNVNGLGAKAIKSGTDDLAGGEIVAGRVVMVFYNGTNFQLLSAAGGSGAADSLGFHAGGCIALHAGGCITLRSATDLASARGNLSVAHLDDGTAASAATVWRGDGKWGSVPGIVATNAALALARTSDHPNGVRRIDYAAGRNAGSLDFMPQTGTCAGNSMVNDGGHCVDVAGGNSVRAAPPADGVGLRQFGADPTGAVDAAAAVNAAMAAYGDSSIPIIVDGKFRIDSALASDKRVTLRGRGGRDIGMTSCPAVSSFIASSDINLLRLTGTTYDVTDICFQMGTAAGQRASGAAFWGGRAAARQDGGQFKRNVILYPYDGIVIGDASGPNATGTFLSNTDENWVIDPYHIGIQNGRDSYGLTTNGGTFVHNFISCNNTHTTGIGMVVYDGAPTVDFGSNPPYYCDIASQIIPGTIGGTHGQGALVFWQGGIGDSSRTHELVIDATTPAARVLYTQFSNNPWVGATEITDAPVVIQNTGGTLLGVRDIQFTGGMFHGATSNTNAIVSLSGQLCRVTFNGTSIVGDVGGPATMKGLSANNVTCATENTFNVSGAHIGHGGINLATGVEILGTTNHFSIIGSSISELTTTPISWTSSSTSVATIKDNQGAPFEFVDAIIADSCVGLDTGTCAMDTGSSLVSWSATLSPAGTPANTGTLFFHFAGVNAANVWRCSVDLKTGSTAWAAGATANDVSNATQPIVRWNNNGTNLTAGQTYKMTGSCNRM